jgi:hypothetical protein
MKARIKATGEIVDIAEYSTIYAENYDTCFYPNELEFLDNSEDYWTRLEHQAAIAAMQGMLANPAFPKHSQEGYYKKNVVNNAYEYAHALVDKMKEQ